MQQQPYTSVLSQTWCMCITSDKLLWNPRRLQDKSLNSNLNPQQAIIPMSLWTGMLIFSDTDSYVSLAQHYCSESFTSQAHYTCSNMEMERNLVKLYIGYTGLLTEWWMCPLTQCKIYGMCLPVSVSQHGLIDNIVHNSSNESICM